MWLIIEMPSYVEGLCTGDNNCHHVEILKGRYGSMQALPHPCCFLYIQPSHTRRLCWVEDLVLC